LDAFLVEKGGYFDDNKNNKEDNYDKDNNHNLQVGPLVVVAWEGSSLKLDRKNGQWRGGLLSEQEGWDKIDNQYVKLCKVGVCGERGGWRRAVLVVGNT